VYTPTRSHSVEQRIRNSRFIARAEPFADPRGARARVEEIRAANPGCAHVVYTFSVGDGNSRSFGMSDDGEPHGTAGRPALDVLKGSDITNCLVTVVRYFGGTKLGTGGLVRAYAGATREVLAGVPVEELVEKRRFSVSVPYELYEPVRKVLLEAAAEIENEEFTEIVRVEGKLPADAAASCSETLREATSGAVSLDVADGEERD
jgi:uncharacterized YigZ family protein